MIDQNLQRAMTEDNDNSLNREVKDQYDRSVGTVTQVYDNTGHAVLPPYLRIALVWLSRLV